MPLSVSFLRFRLGPPGRLRLVGHDYVRIPGRRDSKKLVTRVVRELHRELGRPVSIDEIAQFLDVDPNFLVVRRADPNATMDPLKVFVVPSSVLSAASMNGYIAQIKSVGRRRQIEDVRRDADALLTSAAKLLPSRERRAYLLTANDALNAKARTPEDVQRLSRRLLLALVDTAWRSRLAWPPSSSPARSLANLAGGVLTIVVGAISLESGLVTISSTNPTLQQWTELGGLVVLIAVAAGWWQSRRQ